MRPTLEKEELIQPPSSKGQGHLSDRSGSWWSFPRSMWDLVWEALLLKESETVKATNKI